MLLRRTDLLLKIGNFSDLLQLTHPKKEVDEALEYAESHGWTIQKASGHAWGRHHGI